MIIKKKNIYHNLLFISSLLLFLFPAAQISGPFLTDSFLIITSIIFLFIYIGSFFGKGNGTSLSVLIFFIISIFVSRKIKKHFINSKLNSIF